MEAHDFRLVALVPPGSAQAEIGRIQAEVFESTGLASSQALPPLIPVQFIAAGGSERALLEDLDRATRAPWRMSTGELAWVEGHLFLRVDSMGTWSTLRARDRLQDAADPAGLFPVSEGIFLGCGEATTAQRDALRAHPQSTTFSSCAIAVLRIRAPRGHQEWWREVYWDMLEQKPLRGRRQS
jgi:hypothetical protein